MGSAADILVVGAGISGLAFASTYLSVHPKANVIIIEKEEVLGGTWSRRRMYDHFWTQWSVGFGEYSNQPMNVPPEHDQFHGLFKSKHTMKYLEEYAAGQIFQGVSLESRIHFSTLVTNIRKEASHWEVDVRDVLTSRPRTMLARRLVLASGLTTVPKIPKIQGADTFHGPMIHNVDFGSSKVLADPEVRHITVLGGGKSGADMAYACAKAGKSVAWIVRPSGTGPCIFVGAQGKGSFNNAFELASTRAAEALQPSYYAPDNWWTAFLHRTRLGQTLVNGIFTAAHNEAVADADYAGRASRGDFGKLAPHTPLFWRNNAAGIINHEDFYDMIANSIDVFYDDVQNIRAKSIHLKSGRSIETDALLLGTGWESSLGYIPPSLCAQLGIPCDISDAADDGRHQAADTEEWVEYEREADAEVVARFPILANPPAHVRLSAQKTPSRLYNLVVPIDDTTRSIACVGMVETTNYFRTTETQSFWVTAYFDGKLELPPLEERKRDVAQFVAWNRRRYLSSGNSATSISFDTMRYTDHLLAELGLTSHLKRGLAHIFSPNHARDYAGLREEYKSRYGGDDLEMGHA